VTTTDFTIRGDAIIEGVALLQPRSSDPSNPPDGAMWYRADLDEYHGVENGTVVSFDTTTI
jgi:hypothetical protein